MKATLNSKVEETVTITLDAQEAVELRHLVGQYLCGSAKWPGELYTALRDALDPAVGVYPPRTTYSLRNYDPSDICLRLDDPS